MSASEAKAAIFGYRCDVAEGPTADSPRFCLLASLAHRVMYFVGHKWAPHLLLRCIGNCFCRPLFSWFLLYPHPCLDVADVGLAALIDVDVLDPDGQLTFAPVLVEGFPSYESWESGVRIFSGAPSNSNA
jgi:hypothetical protein